jgi:hypothetical protein
MATSIETAIHPILMPLALALALVACRAGQAHGDFIPCRVDATPTPALSFQHERAQPVAIDGRAGWTYEAVEAPVRGWERRARWLVLEGPSDDRAECTFVALVSDHPSGVLRSPTSFFVAPGTAPHPAHVAWLLGDGYRDEVPIASGGVVPCSGKSATTYDGYVPFCRGDHVAFAWKPGRSQAPGDRWLQPTPKALPLAFEETTGGVLACPCPIQFFGSSIRLKVEVAVGAFTLQVWEKSSRGATGMHAWLVVVDNARDRHAWVLEDTFVEIVETRAPYALVRMASLDREVYPLATVLDLKRGRVHHVLAYEDEDELVRPTLDDNGHVALTR